jgi:hypothetical protein
MVEPTTIFLSACVIVLIYLVYYTYTFNATLLLTSISPANYPITITPPVPATGSIAASFTYSIWINVNDWTVNQTFYKNILSYGTSTYISLDKTTNDVVVALNRSTGGVYSATVIKNIPLQTWVHLAFSLSGTTLDSYVNGRLVTTNLVGSTYIVPKVDDKIILGGAIAQPTGCAGAGAVIGTYSTAITDKGCNFAYSATTTANPGFSGYVTQFQYSQTASDPQTIWNIFNQGNGTSMFSNFFGNYGLSVALTNNGVAQNTISI